MTATMDITFHYPPELISLLINCIPRLCPRKRDVILFFKGAGVKSGMTNDLVRRLNQDKTSIGKYEMAEKVLTRLNEKGEGSIRERREVLKRVVEWEDFSMCWPADRLEAQGLVAEIRRVINVKDSFTRMKIEKEEAERKHREEHEGRLKKEAERKTTFANIRADLSRLFGITDPQRRGKALEGVMNRLFNAAGIAVTEAFTLTGTEGEGIVEQIDGAIEIGGNIYLVEMKWTREAVGKAELSEHFSRIFLRGGARAIFVSNAGYTDPAISMCRDALAVSVVVLCKLEEFVVLLDKEEDLVAFLNEKIQAAVVHKNPLYEPVKRFP